MELERRAPVVNHPQAASTYASSVAEDTDSELYLDFIAESEHECDHSSESSGSSDSESEGVLSDVETRMAKGKQARPRSKSVPATQKAKKRKPQTKTRVKAVRSSAKRMDLHQHHLYHVFVHHNIVMKGCLDLIDSWYVKGEPAEVTPNTITLQQFSAFRKNRPQDRSFGMTRGIVVDHQLSKWAKAKGMVDKSEFARYHSFTQQAIKFFKLRKWTPVRGQMCVGGVTTAGVATAIDLVVQTDKGDYLAIELKCVCEDDWARPDADHPHFKSKLFTSVHLSKHWPKWCDSLGRWSNTPFARALIQLQFGMALYERMSKKAHAVAFKDGYVVQIHSKGIACYSLAEAGWPRELVRPHLMSCLKR